MEPLLDPEFYSNITKEVDEAWKEKHGKNVSDTIKDYLLTYLGEPLHQLIRYMYNYLLSIIKAPHMVRCKLHGKAM